MYSSIKEALVFKEEDVYSIEQAYEELYRSVVRLEDMDDFSEDMLVRIKEKISNGTSVEEAFTSVIDESYEFADGDYFKYVISKYRNDLLEFLDSALKSKNPQKSWHDDINYFVGTLRISVDGKEYHIKELQSMLERRYD